MTGKQPLFRNRSFVLFLSGQTLCEFGTGIQLFVIPWMLLQLTGSASILGMAMAVGFLPYLLCSLPFGAYADRYNRKTLMILANIGRLAAVASIPVASGMGEVQPLQLFIVQACISACSSLFDAAYVASLPRIVDKSQLQDANSALQAGLSVSQISGPALGGLLVAWLGGGDALIVTGGTLLISIITLLAMPASFRVEPTSGRRPRILSDVAEGARFVWRHPLIRVLTVLAMIINLNALTMNPAVVFRLQHELKLDAEIAGMVLSAWGVGTVVGSIGSGRIARRISFTAIMLVSLSLQTVSPLLFLFVPSAPVMGLAYFLYGFAIVLWNVQTITLRQRHIPDHLLGRAGSTIRMLIFATIPLGNLIGGYASEHFGSMAAFGFAGALQLGLLLWFARVGASKSSADAPTTTALS